MQDEDLERYLRRFEPRLVRALKVPARPKTIRPGWLVAAALVILLGGVLLWRLRQETNGTKKQPIAKLLPATTPNAIALVKLALEDNERFDAFLIEQSRTVLPSFQQDGSALAVLAKE
jgi:hypothetical protein